MAAKGLAIAAACIGVSDVTPDIPQQAAHNCAVAARGPHLGKCNAVTSEARAGVYLRNHEHRLQQPEPAMANQ